MELFLLLPVLQSKNLFYKRFVNTSKVSKNGFQNRKYLWERHCRNEFHADKSIKGGHPGYIKSCTVRSTLKGLQIQETEHHVQSLYGSINSKVLQERINCNEDASLQCPFIMDSLNNSLSPNL